MARILLKMDISIKIDTKIYEIKFLCDLAKCKGGCCTIYGENGAPLLYEEIPQIENNLEKIKKFMLPQSIKFLEKNGFWVHDSDGDLSVQCINNRDCVFVYYDENSIAKCAIEKAYIEGESSFRKPVSCHLFPIRVRKNYVYYEKFDVCEPALENGKRHNIDLLDFVSAAIERRFPQEIHKIILKKHKEE